MEVSVLIKEDKLVYKLFDDDGNEVYAWYRRMAREDEPFLSTSYGENRSHEDILLDLGIDDEDLIDALNSLDNGASEVMAALFFLTH
nr:MAG TPA: hypothetical protein [Caudovirales sp. ctNII2]